MANTIKIKNSGTASNVPASLEYGELGLNYADGKLFYKNNSNAIVEFVGQKGDTGAGGALGYWGSFWSTQSQSAVSPNTAYAITLNNTDSNSNGVSVVSNSRVTFANAGVYSLTFSVQWVNTSNDIVDGNIWFRKNGTNIPDSDSKWSVVSKHGGVNGHAIGTVNVVLSLAANDYIELTWQTNNTALSLEYVGAASPAPAIPSVIFTATQVMYTQLPTVTQNAQTGNYTLVLGDAGKMIEMNVGSANNLTVPADNTVNFPVGTSIDILQVGSGQTTIVPASGVTINRASGLKTRLQWSAATLIKRAANTWVAIGDLSA
jgi:hypothetical protein